MSGKSGNEGILRIPEKTVLRAGPILLFAEKRTASNEAGHDEHFPAGILTSGFKPCVRLPALSRCGMMTLVSRYSGATVLEFHEVP